jgi:hypothetical protein
MRTLLLTLITCLFVLPAQAKYSGGTGEPNDPYQIATAEDLIALGETPEDYDKHFILTADIDLDPNLPGGRVFDRAVIAPGADDLAGHFQGTQFTGVFDGNGHTISRLTIRGEQYVGLFGSASAEISNLGLVDPHVTAEDGNNVGALVAEGGWHVFNCYVEGGRVTGKDGIGGLIGFVRNSLIANCCTRVSVSGHKWVGGLAGRAFDTYITYSYVAGDVTGDEDVGGIVGRVPESGNSVETIEDSYSLATVSGNVKTGGFAGSNYGRVINCYSVGRVTGNEKIGGFIGYNEGKITACFWDVEASGCVTSAAGTSKTTAEMKPRQKNLWVVSGSGSAPRL